MEIRACCSLSELWPQTTAHRFIVQIDSSLTENPPQPTVTDTEDQEAHSPWVTLWPMPRATGTSTPAYEPAGVVAGLQLHILEPLKDDFGDLPSWFPTKCHKSWHSRAHRGVIRGPGDKEPLVALGVLAVQAVQHIARLLLVQQGQHKGIIVHVPTPGQLLVRPQNELFWKEKGEKGGLRQGKAQLLTSDSLSPQRYKNACLGDKQPWVCAVSPCVLSGSSGFWKGFT